MGKRVSEVYHPCVPSPWGLRGSSPDVILRQILVHSTLVERGCLERGLSFQAIEAIFKKSRFAKEQKRPEQHWIGSLFSFSVQSLGAPCQASGIGCGVACRLTSNLESSSITMGPNSHLSSPPTAQQPCAGWGVGGGGWSRGLGRQRSDLVPLVQKCLDISAQRLVWRDQTGDQIRWGRPLHGLGVPPWLHSRRGSVWQPPSPTQDDWTELCCGAL